MRWKWLLVLSLVSISLIAVSGDDEVKNDEEYDDEKIDEGKTDEKVEEETIADNAGEGDEPSVDTDPPAAVAEDVEAENEDAVDVEKVAIGKQQGKYMNYDDYFLSSAIDGSDTGYNWDGESFCNLESLQ